ncbi:MAG: DUF4391 domain-containing protein [Deltaproteobacteria bacterium]|nr:DUF4391 domain-containing protein [Deltaproteobacteria bacterium]
MIESFYERMAIPDTCHLGKRVFKKLFHENAKLGVTDKKALRDDIDVITWQYTLKPSTIPINAYEDEQRDYPEIAFLQVDLKTLNRTKRLAEVIHRAIPYPLVVVFVYQASCAMSLAHKRFSQAEKGAIVAEDIIISDWISIFDPTPVQWAFLNSLYIPDLPHTHYWALYTAFMDRLIALSCAMFTGEYRLDTTATKRKDRRVQLLACHELEIQIEVYKAEIKKETQFNRKVELNMKFKMLEQQLAQTITRLKQI